MPHPPPALPADHQGRPATADDVDALHALVTECERALHDRAQTDPGGIAADLNRPGLIPELDTLVVHDRAGRLPARAWVNRRSEVDVHPAHRGRGLGAALLDWAEARARRAGSEAIVQTVPDTDRPAAALLRSRDYQPLVAAWELTYAMAEEPAVPGPPAGVTVRPFDSGDARAVHRLVEDAFAAWQPRRRSYEEWARHTVDRAAFAADCSAVALVDGQLVGAVLALDLPDADGGHLEQVAVRRDHRDRGIARLLLRQAFRAFHRHGRRNCTLWTHSDTGALDLYLRVGMTVSQSSTVFRKELGREELVREELAP
ncbi:GNAT family N-acetyltransferase [Streptomyces sp. WZ-12]|uniref:GNAT family N-acetyltransferase n=1 Tax=Streptomyces sp. WZ-12 TaxID=3030210 RepID=UPI00238144CD|nr:GNAT family N-acetyltransferase [Streptomyces sp. WZ-12]